MIKLIKKTSLEWIVLALTITIAISISGCSRHPASASNSNNESQPDSATVNPSNQKTDVSEAASASQQDATGSNSSSTSAVTKQDDSKTQSNVYENTQYGFRFSLPETWKGYTIITDKWKGEQDTQKIETGPILSIRHPLWTEKDPRQDIPIMILTLSQWSSLQQDKFHIGAAPIAPSELGRNSKYVFALPARYNYAFPTGYEEVETIINSKPLKPIEPNK